LAISKLPELPPATQNAAMNQRQFPDQHERRPQPRPNRPFHAASRTGGRGGNFPRRRFGR
jgi:hypothetical protein